MSWYSSLVAFISLPYAPYVDIQWCVLFAPEYSSEVLRVARESSVTPKLAFKIFIVSTKEDTVTFSGIIPASPPLPS